MSSGIHISYSISACRYTCDNVPLGYTLATDECSKLKSRGRNGSVRSGPIELGSTL
jgi:hypothetical protein